PNCDLACTFSRSRSGRGFIQGIWGWGGLHFESVRSVLARFADDQPTHDELTEDLRDRGPSVAGFRDARSAVLSPATAFLESLADLPIEIGNPARPPVCIGPGVVRPAISSPATILPIWNWGFATLPITALDNAMAQAAPRQAVSSV